MSKKSFHDNVFLLHEPPALVRLRRLIAHMSATEKTSFKRYIRNYSDNNKESKYIQIFDCINDTLAFFEKESNLRQESFNPGELDAVFFERFLFLFNRRDIANPRDIAAKAHYLYEKILEALRPAGMEQNLRRALYARMLDVQLLFNKELYEECLSMIRNVRDLAEKLEAWTQLLELRQIERNILLLTAREHATDDLRSIYEAEHRYLKELVTSIDFNDLRQEMLIALWGGKQLDEEALLRSKINNFLQYLTAAAPRNSFDTELHYRSVMVSMIWLDLKHPNQFLRFLNHEGWTSVVGHLKAIVDLYEKHPLRKAESPHRYQTNLFNYLITALNHNVEVNIESYRQDLDEVQPSDPAFLYNVAYLTLVYSIKKRQFKEGRDFIIRSKMYGVIEQIGNKIPSSRLQVLRNLAGIIYFVREEYAEANKWFEANLKTDGAIKNAEAQLSGTLYSLICRFELGFSDSRSVARKLLEPLENMLESTDDPESFESGLLDVLLKMLRTGPKSEQFPKLVDTAIPLLQERLKQKKDPGHFNLFIGWLESKKQGKSLRFVIDKYI
jgi:hypothetical protein